MVNGTEEYEKGTNRREDGILVDNRNVTALNPSIIAGTNSTAIKGGNLVNTSQIGITGTTQIELTGKGINASIGNNIGKINGNIVLVEGNKGIRNIGGEIKGREATQVTSKEGKVINESSITTKELTREVELGRFFKHIGKTVTEVYGIIESIRNVGKIESNGTVYVEAKEAENIAGNIKGSEGTVIKSTEKDIVDRTIALREDKHGQVEVKEVTRPVRRGIGKISGDKVETVQVGTKWDSWTKTVTVSGEIGEGKNTILESARDIILESSNVKGKENIALNAKRYLTMLSTVDTEYKQRSETHKSGRVKKKTTTNNWIEDNVYANNVDLTSDGNILMNFRKVGAPADNKGVFAQGVNFNAKGGIIGLSDGNIYVQGTKDRLNSVFNSHTTKRFMGVRYGSGSDYVSDTREKYKLSQLYGEAGITYDAQGKLKVEGADIQTQGNVYLRGKQGVEILLGVENSIREEEHKTSGIKGSFGVSWSGISAGVGYGKSRDRISEITKEIIANRLEAAGDVEIKSEEGNVDIYPVNGYIGGKLTLTGKDINILDMQSERITDRETENSYVGVGVNFGVPAISAAQQIWEAGKGLTKAKHKEDYINAGFGAFNAGMNAVGALGGNVLSSGMSLNYSKNRNNYHREESMSVGSNLRIGKGVEYNGSNLHTRGLNIINEGDTVYNITGKIIKEAGKSTIKETSDGKGFGISVSHDMSNSWSNNDKYKQRKRRNNRSILFQ